MPTKQSTNFLWRSYPSCPAHEYQPQQAAYTEAHSIGLPDTPSNYFHDFQLHHRLPYIPLTPISRIHGVVSPFLKIYCYGLLASHMVPGALVPLHDQYILKWNERLWENSTLGSRKECRAQSIKRQVKKQANILNFSIHFNSNILDVKCGYRLKKHLRVTNCGETGWWNTN